jgi:hypothetical protein
MVVDGCDTPSSSTCAVKKPVKVKTMPSVTRVRKKKSDPPPPIVKDVDIVPPPLSASLGGECSTALHETSIHNVIPKPASSYPPPSSIPYSFASSDNCPTRVPPDNFIMRLSFPQLLKTDNPDPYNKEESFVFEKNRSCTFSSIHNHDTESSFCAEDPNDNIPFSDAILDGHHLTVVDPTKHDPFRITTTATSTTSIDMDSTKHPDPFEWRHRNIVKLLMEFEKKSSIGDWPLTTNVHCYWCCHKFDGAPIGLPVKMNLEENKYCVVGCFCSLECACAYNFASKENTDECLNRYSLLNSLATRLGITSRVNPAPDRLSLKMFGGNLGIKEFREFASSERFVIVNTPPMISITQQIEEVHENDTHSGYRYVPLDNERVTKFQEKIRLKRNKPLVNTKNTLDHSMKLTYNNTDTLP